MTTPFTPELRVGSYLKYKADTNCCLSWLLDAAVASGYTIPLASSRSSVPLQSNVSSQISETAQSLGQKLREKQALKAAKRKERDDPRLGSKAAPLMKYVVKTRELITQAKVAAEKGAKVPQAIIHAFERAIAARKRSAAWYKSSSTSSEQSNVQHQHFITLLEEVFYILRSPRTKDPNSETNSPVLNKFESLDIDDTEDESEDATPPTTSPAPHAPEPKPEPAYEFEFQDSFNADERRFAITCLFEDLHAIQAFVREIWQSYKERDLDLQTTSFLTNVAIEIARKEEENLIGRFFPPGTKASQNNLVQSLRNNADTASMMDEESTLSSLMITPFDDFVYNRPSSCIVKFLESYRYTSSNSKWPFAVPLQETVHVHPDQQHLLELSAFKKAEEDDIYLTQLLLDQIFVAGCSSNNLFPSEPEEPPPGLEDAQPMETKPVALNSSDAFSRGFRDWLNDLCENGVRMETSAWFAFAAQIQLDIRDVLDDHIQDTNRHFGNTLIVSQESLKLDRPRDRGIYFERYWPREPSTDRPYDARIVAMVVGSESYPVERARRHEMSRADIQNIKSKLRPSLDDMDSASKESRTKEILRSGSMEDYIKRRNERAVVPLEDTHYFSPSTPLARGTQVLGLNLAMEEAGLYYTNFNGNSFIIAHLYNAVLQANLLKSTWPHMEEFIRLHQASLFLGHRTTNHKEIGKHYVYKVGLVPSSVCPKNHFKPKFKQGWERGPQLPLNPINLLLQQLYDETSDMNMPRCLAQLQKDLTSQKSGSKAAHRQPQLSSVEFLRLLRTSLPPTIQSIRFDYIELSRVCLDLLKRIRFTIVHELGVDYSSIMTGREGYGGYGPMGSGYFMMVADLLFEKEGGPQMKIAARVLEKHINGP